MLKHSVAITPDDDNDLSSPSKVQGLVATTSGNIAVVLEKDADEVADAIILAVTAGVPIQGFSIRRVKTTGTTASGIRGLY